MAAKCSNADRTVSPGRARRIQKQRTEANPNGKSSDGKGGDESALTAGSEDYSHISENLKAKKQLRHCVDDAVNEEAQHAIFKIKSRLESSMSVDAQVNELIQEATNKERLASMFPGVYHNRMCCKSGKVSNVI